MNRRLPIGLLLSIMLISSTTASAEDWPRFRGPTGQGISADPNPPTRWSETDHVAWKTEVPGEGWSSPIVWGDRVFLTSATDGGASCHVICFDRAGGKMLWDVPVLKQETLRKEGKNSWATPTPVADGQRVYSSFGGGVAALTFDGKVAWTNTEYPFYSRHGLAASPVPYKDLLILGFDGSNKVPDNGGKPPPEEYIGWQKPWDQGFVVALDTKTGKTRWRSMRGLMTRISHVTPMVIDVEGQPQLVSSAGDYVEAFDPDSGKPLWWVRSDGETPVPSVVYGDGLVFTTSGFPTYAPSGPWIRAIRPGKKGEFGDLTATHVAWETKRNVPMMPSFLFVGNGPEADHLLVWTHYNGVATCVEPTTGKEIWQHRIEGNYSASPTYAAGKIYFLNEDGKTTILEAGKEFKVVGENTIDTNEHFQASPAFSNGEIFIRSDKHLYCIK
jgi:outer membrane protein assembly factor BamB